jgi:copper(I)-binding protein
MKFLTLFALWLLIPMESLAQIEGSMIFVDQPWARETKGKNGAVFMNILNNESDEWNLVSANTTICDRVELHTHIQEGDIFRMRPVKEISLNPGTVTELKPGGLHIMLMGLKEELTTDKSFELTLKFQSEKNSFMLVISVPVKEIKKPCCSHSH